MGVRILLMCILLFVNKIFAQTHTLVYDNKVFQSNIKTVECYNSKKEQSFPIYNLNGTETLTLSFDDLNGGNKGYSYTVEHCTFDWKPSKINSIEYLESFNEDIITKYRYSFNTLQKFTHYEIKLPNDQIRPKIAGNYILKVYENGNKNRLIITQRFFVLDQVFNVGTEIVASSSVSDRFKKQKINFSIFHQTPIQNPNMDVKAVVMQNNNPKSTILNTRPTFVKPGSLVYNALNENEFWGGNEFRKFDTRSFRFKGDNVQDLFVDTIFNALLFTDAPSNSTKYSNQFDENGNFFVRNQDGREKTTDSDYAKVIFSLGYNPSSTKGSIYVWGGFNNYSLETSNRLTYDPTKRKYSTSIKLKQGLYDYKYVWQAEDGTLDHTLLEGSFFETENNYQVFVYYRKPGGRWDELLGHSSVNSQRR
ncbi:MAG: DUF5103 domain-containing protein [Pedobacter sp.]|nr:MAG: DUF5103 domain-containing protein [Pedobacter sp.]